MEFNRRGRLLVDGMVIFHQREPRNLEAAYLKYCGRELENAHCAEEDARAAAEVLDGQLEMYQDLPRDEIVRERGPMSRGLPDRVRGRLLLGG